MTTTFSIRAPGPDDLPTILSLNARVFGPGRFARSAYRVREGLPPISALCRIAELEGALAASLRMTAIEVGGVPGALLLGPLAVEPALAGQGYGKALVGCVIDEAKAQGSELIVLVGNMSYYERFGFRPLGPGQIVLPGPVDPARILARELRDGAVPKFKGLVRAAQVNAS